MHSRWRGGRPYDQNRHSAQRHSNARTMSAHGGSRGGQNNWGDSRDQFASGPQQEQHVPVRGFNAAEAKGALRKGKFRPASTRKLAPANTQLALHFRTGRCVYHHSLSETNTYDYLSLTLISSSRTETLLLQTTRKGREQPRERTLGRKTYVTTSPGNNSTKHTINDLTRTTTYTANQMANGKDFFLELRKQVTALQQGGTVAGG